MEGPTTDDPGAALMQRLRSFTDRMSAAMALVNRDPGAGLDALQALLGEVAALQAESMPWAEAVARREGGTAEWVADLWRQWRAELHLSLAMTQHRVGEIGDSAGHLKLYLEQTSGRRQPQRATALGLLARQALDAGRPDLAREWADAHRAEAATWTDAAAWKDIAPPGQEDHWALQARGQIAAALVLHADVDLLEGDREAYLAQTARALQLWAECGSDADVRSVWWARMQMELLWDASGQRLDQADEAVRAAAPPSVRDQPDFQRRLLQVRAAVWAQRGRHATARGLLQRALDAMDPQDFSAWSLRLDLADALSAQGDHAAALAEAQRAVVLAASAQSPMVVRRCADHLRSLQIASGDPQALQQALQTLDAEADDPHLPADTLSRLQTRVTLLLVLKRADEALATVERIEAAPAAVRGQASISDAALASMRAAALREAGRVAEAAAVLEAAMQALSAPDEGKGRVWRDEGQQFQDLALGAALQHADLGHADDVLRLSERARGVLWQSALRRHGHDPASFDLEAVRASLRRRRAAVLVLVQGRGRTAAVAMPADGGPARCHVLPHGRTDWHERLADMERGEANWNPRFEENLAVFSAWLGPLLAEAAAGAELLCIVPEGALALVPWSGLSLPDGRPLSAHVASALLPALQFAVDVDRPAAAGRGLLSAGAGHSHDQARGLTHDFDAMAVEVAQAAQVHGQAARAMPDAPLDRFLAEAPAFASLHLSMHGNVQPGQLDPLAASTLEFSGAQRLSARRLAEHWDGGVAFEHVFVNACVSAGYAFGRDAGAGGFWHALLGVGARAVTGTLAYVDPVRAQELALAFHRHAPSRVGPALALCLAQRDQAAAGHSPSAWATHTTVLARLPAGSGR